MADKLLGSFVWCELMTSDKAGAESFYKKVVGWGTEPFGPDGSYTVLNNSTGVGVGGIMTLPAEAKGMPPCWMMYIGTPDVDAMAMRVAQLGGRVLKQPSEIPNVGRFAVVSDPYGAVFNIFTPRGPDMDRSKGTGRFSWFELYTPNPEGAWRFYESLFGWEKTSAMDMGEMGVYQMFGRGGGIPNGGIMKPPPGAPPAWMPYALVKDAKGAAAAATANGGKIVNGPMEVPGGDWIAVGIDPQGATFAVHSLNPAAQAAAAAVKTAKKVAAAVTAAAVLGAAAKKIKAKLATSKKAAPKKKATAAKKKPTSAKATVGKARKSAKPMKKKVAPKKATKKAKKAAKRKK